MTSLHVEQNKQRKRNDTDPVINSTVKQQNSKGPGRIMTQLEVITY